MCRHVARAVVVAGLGVLPFRAEAQGDASSLSGIVVDQDRHPVESAEVRWLLATGPVAVRTDTAGRFTFGVVPAGEYRVAVRRLGYEPRVVVIGARRRSDAGIEIVLTATPALMEALRVTSGPGKLDEFYRRREHPNRLGRFLGPSDFTRTTHRLLSEYLRGIPGVSVSSSTQIIGNTVRFRGCQPLVWLDGLRMAGVEVDEVVQARDVAAVEVYLSPTGSPARYRDPTRPCGSLIVWMKS